MNKIFNGDCLEVMCTLEDGSVDLILTDPPYGISDGSKITFTSGKPKFMVEKTEGEFSDQLTDKEMFDLYENLVKHAYRLLKPDGSIIVFYDRNKPYLLMSLFKSFKIRNNIIFVKSNPSPHMRKNNYRSGYEQCLWFSKDKYKINFINQKTMVNVFYGKTEKHHTTHPTEKYGWMIKPLIERHSDPDDLILDPFMGSGRICVEAKKLGRKYIGIDIEQKWCDVGGKWLEETSLSPLVTMVDVGEWFR